MGSRRGEENRGRMRRLRAETEVRGYTVMHITQ